MNRASVALLAPIVALSLSAAAGAQCPYSWLGGQGMPGLDSPYALAIADWDLDGAGPAPAVVVVAGSFQFAGTTYANNIVLFEPQSGSWSPLGTGVGGTIRAVAPTANGLYVGGSFAWAGSQPCANLARWNGYSWSPVGGGLDGYVAAMAVAPNGDLVVGGTFSHAGGVAVNNLARWNGSSWSDVGGGAGPGVQALAFAPNGDLVVGGYLTSVGGAPASNVARWDGTTWSAFGSGTDLGVQSLAFAPNGDLYAGGYFGVAGSAIAHGLARWDGSQWSGLGLPAPGSFNSQQVRGLAFDQNGDLMATGAIHVPGGMFGAIRFSGGAAGGSAVPETEGEGYGVHHVPGLGFVVGAGRFGVGRAAASLQPIGGGTDGPVSTSLRTTSGETFVGGGFQWLQGVAANGIARLAGGAYAPLGAGLNGSCYTLLERSNGHLVVGGLFTTAGQLPARNLAEWNGSTWSGIGGGVNGQVNALLELANGDLVVAGQFATVGPSQLITGSVAVYDGSSWAPLAFNIATAAVRALCQLPNGDLIAGGSMSQVGHVARWNGTSWVALGGGTNGVVQSLTVLADGRLVAAGNFSDAGGVFVENCAVWDGVAWQRLGFGPGGPIHDIVELPDGTLCAVGAFAPYGVAFQRDGMPFWGSFYGAPTLFNGAADTVVASPGGELLIGGTFSGSTNGSAYLMRGTPGCPAEVLVEGSGCVGAAGPVELAPDNLPWLGTTYRSTGTGVPAGSLVVLVRSTATASLSLPAVFPQAGVGCQLLVAPEQLAVLLPTGNEVQAELALPNDPWFLGTQVHEQLVPFTFGPTGLVAVQSSNALRLTIGAL
ncbi:MAG: hypothetical protein R3F29_12855 [Planctomycetota bacterium]